MHMLWGFAYNWRKQPPSPRCKSWERGLKNDRWGRHECRGRLIQFVFDGMSRPRNDQTSCDPFYDFVKVLCNLVKVPYTRAGLKNDRWEREEELRPRRSLGATKQ